MTVLKDDMMDTEDINNDTAGCDVAENSTEEDINVVNIHNTDTVDNSEPAAGAEDDGELVNEGGEEEDLEEGECTSDDEPEPAPATMVQEVKEERRRAEKKHRRTRSRSRDRHKRSKRVRKELDEEEKKKREVLRKLKALEENMGLVDDWEEDEETPMASEEEESSDESRSGSRSSSESPGRRRSRERRKREREKRHARKRKRERTEICQMFMQVMMIMVNTKNS